MSEVGRDTNTSTSSAHAYLRRISADAAYSALIPYLPRCNLRVVVVRRASTGGGPPAYVENVYVTELDRRRSKHAGHLF